MGSTREKKWVICPMCKQPNPVGGLPFCKSCQEAMPHWARPVSYQEMEEISKRRLRRYSGFGGICRSVLFDRYRVSTASGHEFRFPAGGLGYVSS